MFSRFFIDRPIFAAVVSIFIVLAGLAAMRNLPIAQYPEIAPPVVTVQAVYPGASAETLEQTVAAPLENQITGIEKMIYMSSTSGSNGIVQIQVTFDIGADADQAALNVNNRVKQAEPRLPEEVRRQGVTVQKGSSAFLQVLAFYSPDGRYDNLAISNFVTLNVLDALKRVPGTTNVQIFGAKDYAMRIWVRPDRLTQLRLTPGDLIRALNEQNAQFAAGKVGQSPSAGPQELVYTITTKGRLADPKEFENIIVRANPDGSNLRLKDVARVELASKDYEFVGRMNGREATLAGIFLLPGANALVVDDAIVVLENIERIMHEEHLAAREAAIKAMREVAGPVVAIVLVLCSVFVPIAFLGGLAGELYRQFAVTIAIAVVISGIVALTLTPSLCVLILKREHKIPGGFFRWFNDAFLKVTHQYSSGLAAMIRRAAIGMIVFASMVAIPVGPPPIFGLGTAGGFELYLQNRGEGGARRMAEVMGGFMQQTSKDPKFAFVQTLWRPAAPQLYVDVDREKAKALGVPLNELYGALAATLGNYYVNDFNKFGRTWQVLMSAEPEYRKSPDAVGDIYVRSEKGEMIPLRSLANVKYASGPDSLARFNNLPAVKLFGAAAPGISSGQAIEEVERIARQALPADFSFDWGG